MARAKEGLLLLGFLMLLYLCVFGTILHMLEYDAQVSLPGSATPTNMTLCPECNTNNLESDAATTQSSVDAEP